MGRKPHKHRNPLCMIVLLALLTGAVAGASASDLTRERRISEQLDTPALSGQALWLDADQIRFLAILEASTAPRRIGGVILLHDAGEHADWQQVIAPLRHYLAAKGWDSLSLQMPLADNPLLPASQDPLLDESLPRIQLAVDQLKQRGIDRVALLGHGLGARMALDYLADKPAAEVRAFVAIGLPMGGADDPLLPAIGKLKVPMLDLYGSRDLRQVVDSATIRNSAARGSRREEYRQDRIEGADHHFSGLQESLQRIVGAWLHRVAGGAGGPGK